MECGSLAEWFSGLGTLLAVGLALVLAYVGEERRRRFVQRRGQGKVEGHSQVEQLYQIGAPGQLKTRLKITNTGPLSDSFKAYVTEIRGRDDFIEVPLVWMHGYAEGEKAATVREIGAKETAWVDLLTVAVRWLKMQGMFLYLDIGAGVGARNLQLLQEGETELVLRVDPRYGRSTKYEVTVKWDGSYKHPEIECADA